MISLSIIARPSIAWGRLRKKPPGLPRACCVPRRGLGQPVCRRSTPAHSRRHSCAGSCGVMVRGGAKTGRAAKTTLSGRADHAQRAYMDAKPVDLGPILPHQGRHPRHQGPAGALGCHRGAGGAIRRQETACRRPTAAQAYGPARIRADADAARKAGRAKLREQKPDESVPRRPEKCPP
jgi:hypothetical protein